MNTYVVVCAIERTLMNINDTRNGWTFSSSIVEVTYRCFIGSFEAKLVGNRLLRLPSCILERVSCLQSVRLQRTFRGVCSERAKWSILNVSSIGQNIGMQHVLAIVPRTPKGAIQNEEFENIVRSYSQMPPFNLSSPLKLGKKVSTLAFTILADKRLPLQLLWATITTTAFTAIN